MANAENVETTPSQWKRVNKYLDDENKPISCDRQNCKIGSYLIEKSSDGESYSPACVTCEFKGGLGDVFNPDEPRYEPGAPEDFKLAAARILTGTPNSVMHAIRIGRPDTAEMIESYSAENSTK